MLNFLYNTVLGRMILKVLTRPFLSKACGKFLDSGLSKPLIRGFVKKNGIDIAQLENPNFTCFNDCFARRLKEGFRTIDEEKAHLVSPCDGLLSAYHIEDGLVIPVKGSRYSIADLLRDEKLARKYHKGLCLVFRLSTSHYHRYSYPADGVKGNNIFIPGILHTVRPIALRSVPVFIENSREYTVIETEGFGNIVQMEVGAMLVGKIDNYHQVKSVARGEEKGKFLYGGSTIILLVEENKISIDPEIYEKTKEEIETPVLLGEMIGNMI